MRTAGHVLAWVLAGALLVGFVLTVWVGVTGALAYQHLSRIQSGAAKTVTALTTDPVSAAAELTSLADEASAAKELTSGPVWDLACLTPWIGPQLAAFHTVTSSTDELMNDSVLPLAKAAGGVSMDGLRPVGGRLEPGVLSALVEPAQTAAESAKAAAKAVHDIDRTPLVGVLVKAVDQAGDVFTQSATFIDALSRTSQLLPDMLGQNGERNYLILVQNNAEWRSLGGISGSAILLRTNNGAVSLGATQSATELSRDTTQPVVDLPAGITEIYGTKPARYFHNLTQIPDFSIDGALAHDFFQAKTGVAVDGVLAIDPVVLSYMLSATGPVTLPDGEQLAANDAVSLLMNGVYERYPDPAQQDAFFAAATGAVFQAFLEGRGSASGFISALSRAGDEHRLLMWSADPGEQSILADTTIAGPLPQTDEHTARLGVYLNDGTGSKMSYYLHPKVSLGWDACQAAGQNAMRQLALNLDLTNSAPADAASTLPTYITGNGAYGTAPGTAMVVGNIYLPDGFSVVSAETTNGASFAEAQYGSHTVLTFGVDVAPQQSVGVSVVARAVTTASEAEAFVTPTADASLFPVVHAACARTSTATLQ
ncbi:DUF4012 domain-containing protein [Microbacterium sp. CFBP 13617]|nr:DUF4012 domain-containing protein [Microbacterium sp. CFBP 13617]MBD8218534.1 DUF4012 domain-containing protein [Microbacterium sp. CFBP 13617]